MKKGRCSAKVRCKGMKFHRTRSCKNKGSVQVASMWFCRHHIPKVLLSKEAEKLKKCIQEHEDAAKHYRDKLGLINGLRDIKQRRREPCVISSDFCDAPANLEFASARYDCYTCGLPVCAKCSFVLPDEYAKRKTRVCLDCAEEDPARWGFEDADGVVDWWNTKNGAFDHRLKEKA